jgi:hypothetical protein
MERRAKVELFEQIRREYEFGVGTIKGVATKLGVHRRMVAGAGERGTAAAQAGRARATGVRSADPLHRRNPGSPRRRASSATPPTASGSAWWPRCRSAR